MLHNSLQTICTYFILFIYVMQFAFLVDKWFFNDSYFLIFDIFPLFLIPLSIANMVIFFLLRHLKPITWTWKLICQILEQWTQCLQLYSGGYLAYQQWISYFLTSHLFLVFFMKASWVFPSRLRSQQMFLKKPWMAQLQSDRFQSEQQSVERFFTSFMLKEKTLIFLLLYFLYWCHNLLQVEKQCAHFFGVTINEQQAEAGIVVRVTSAAQSKFKVWIISLP